jgi:hypothetical protein
MSAKVTPVILPPAFNPFGYRRRDGSSIDPAGPPRPRIPDLPGAPPVPTPGVVPPVAPPPAFSAFERKQLAQNYAQMMTSGNLPITGVGATFLGSTVDGIDKYVTLFKNTLGRVIAVKVTADFGVALGGFNLSFSQELSNQNLVDRLSAAGRVATDNILLPKEAILYINTADILIGTTGATVRVLLLDPASVFGEVILP